MSKMKLKSALRTGGKHAFMRLHETALRFGLIVLPKHYYVGVPDLHELRRTRASWARRSAMPGIVVDLDRQVRALAELVRPFEAEYRGNPFFRAATGGGFGPGFGYVEAQALHGFLRGTKPRRVVEVGSGVSTYCAVEAVLRNAAEGSPASITCIEPYPSDWLREAPVRLIDSKIEDVDLAVFDELEAGDLLFVDSTHTVRVGGDVVRIVTEILPRLRPGVHVHFHDIYLPYDYQRDADRSIFQWMETALLHAFLIDNDRFEIVFCLSHLHYDRPDALRAVFPEYVPEGGTDGLRKGAGDDREHFPSSIYLNVRDGRDPERSARPSSEVAMKAPPAGMQATAPA